MFAMLAGLTAVSRVVFQAFDPPPGVIPFRIAMRALRAVRIVAPLPQGVRKRTPFRGECVFTPVRAETFGASAHSVRAPFAQPFAHLFTVVIRTEDQAFNGLAVMLPRQGSALDCAGAEQPIHGGRKPVLTDATALRHGGKDGRCVVG